MKHCSVIVTENEMSPPAWLRLGRWLFQARGFSPVPLLLIMFFCCWQECERDWFTWPIGLTLVGSGELMRLWALGYIGKHSRTRKNKIKTIITDGPYALTRNPLYCGNFLIFLGIAVLSELLWFVPVGMGLFCFQYYWIVRYEEYYLKQNFQSEAVRYFNTTNRWLPKWDCIFHNLKERSRSVYDWTNILHRERRTLQFLAVITFLMVFKEIGCGFFCDWTGGLSANAFTLL